MIRHAIGMGAFDVLTAAPAHARSSTYTQVQCDQGKFIQAAVNNSSGTGLAVPPAVAAQHLSTEQEEGLRAPTRPRLTVRLRNGARVSGTALDVDPDAVTLGNANVERGRVKTISGRTTFREGDLAGVELLGPNAIPSGLKVAVVRHAIRGLGVGRKIDLRSATRKLRGTIQSIERDGFSVRHGRSLDRFAYGDVRQLKPAGMHWAVKTAIIAGVVYGAIWISIFFQN